MALGSQDYGVVQDVLLEKKKTGLAFGSSSAEKGEAALGGSAAPDSVARLSRWATSGPAGSGCLGQAGLTHTGYHCGSSPSPWQIKPIRDTSNPQSWTLFKSACLGGRWVQLQAGCCGANPISLGQIPRTLCQGVAGRSQRDLRPQRARSSPGEPRASRAGDTGPCCLWGCCYQHSRAGGTPRQLSRGPGACGSCPSTGSLV